VRKIGRDIREVAKERGFLLLATDPDQERERKMADEALALHLLAGFQDGTPAIQYPKPNSSDEQIARAALARIVRDHVPGFSGELLALAIDPHTPSKTPGMVPTRRIRFESPARGQPSTWARDLLVIGAIRDALFHSSSGKEDAACKVAEDQFGLSPPAVKKIWRRYKRLVGRSQAPSRPPQTK
jgi:hypothetical protein